METLILKFIIQYHLQPLKQMKYSAVKFTKCVYDLYADNYKY